MGSTGSRQLVIPNNIASLIRQYSFGDTLSAAQQNTLKTFIQDNEAGYGTAYRGLDISDAELNSYKVGDVINPRNTVDSFSTSMRAAQEYATRHLYDFDINSHNAVVLVQDKTKGIDISGVSFFEGEREILTVAKPVTITSIKKRNITTYNRRGRQQMAVLTILGVK